MPVEMRLLPFFTRLKQVIQSPKDRITGVACGLCFSILTPSQRCPLNDHKTIAQFSLLISEIALKLLLFVVLYIKQMLLSGKAKFQPVARGHKI